MTSVLAWMILSASTTVAGPPPSLAASTSLAFPPITGWLDQFHGFPPDSHLSNPYRHVTHVHPGVCAPCAEGFGPPTAFRDPEYFFNRQFAVPNTQCFMNTYRNPYIMRGQQFLPFAGCGGCHPMSGPPMASSLTPVTPYEDLSNKKPFVTPPDFSGRSEAAPVLPGSSGLIP
jgi:hypothetical protein